MIADLPYASSFIDRDLGSTKIDSSSSDLARVKFILWLCLYLLFVGRSLWVVGPCVQTADQESKQLLLTRNGITFQLASLKGWEGVSDGGGSGLGLWSHTALFVHAMVVMENVVGTKEAVELTILLVRASQLSLSASALAMRIEEAKNAPADFVLPEILEVLMKENLLLLHFYDPCSYHDQNDSTSN